MKKMLLVVLLFLFAISKAEWNNWNWGNQPPPAPNNNVAIGYPTAYGLYAGRGWGNHNYGGGGGGPPNAGSGFGSPLRCLNGGAHIGQCRLDKDSICIALGGTCTHGACCTTPFVSIMGSTTTESPDVIDGETTKRKGKSKVKFVTTTTTVEPKTTSTEEEEDSMNSRELEEWNKLIERAKTTTTVDTISVELVTVTPYVEESADRKCSSGLRSVGPCSEDADCPTLHQCEGEQCCYLML
ncbi:unnamed protein product [Caenorhabditis sp. 36 PRJEB53466]|nr:unnamed protein product [Caenorhabditis sp. 36 PRJEB53466]